MKWIEKIKNLPFSDEDPQQRSAFSHVLLFFFIMVLLTLIARGANGATLTRVTLVTPSPNQLSQSVQFYGTAKPIGNVFSSVPAGLTVSKVLKEPLDTVVAGDGIALVDQAKLDELVIRKRAALRQMELSLESQMKWSGISSRDMESAQKEVEKAREAFDRIKSDDNISAEEKTAARDKLTATQQALDAAQAAYYEEVLRKQPAARTLMLDIAAAQAEVDALIQVQAQQYQILAETGGQLSDQPLTEGAVTSGTELIGISTPGNGLTLTFQVSREDANNILKYEPELTASQEGQAEKLRSFDPDINTLGQDTVTFTAKLRESEWTEGGISITGDLWESDHDLCIPMSALRQDSDGYFVYVMTTVQTLMSIDKRVARVDVYIEKADGSYAAVTGGLSANDQVILSSSKPLSDGDSVRVGP